MNSVFADTSYFVALVLKADARHHRAAECTRAFSGRLYSTQWVLSELGNYLSPIPLRRLFTGLLADLEIDPDIIIVSAQSSAFREGAKLYADRPDKAWSMVDCISFVTMHEQGITDAWTTDHHFAQAGFNALLA
jgi:predicted nucleic acid-binding protein